MGMMAPWRTASVLLTEKDVGDVPRKGIYREGEENVGDGSIPYDIPFGVGAARIGEDVYTAYLFPGMALKHHDLGPYTPLYTHPSHYIESVLYRTVLDHKVPARKQPDDVLCRL